jgi:branched-chain amino acid transport system substrate-binding protein
MKLFNSKLLIVLLGLLIILSGCGQSASTKPDAASPNSASSSKPAVAEVKIGSTHPVSGAIAVDGIQMVNAIKMAVEEVNEAGGIKALGGAKVSLIESDHENKPEKGVSEVQRLNREGAVAILGPYSSGVALTATQEAEKLKIPFVVTIASSNEVTERGFKYTFRLQPPAKLMSDDFIKYFNVLNAKTQFKTAVIVHEESVYGSSIGEYIEKEAGKMGLKVLARLHHPSNTLDLTSEITKIKSLQPEVIIATTYISDGTLFVKTLQESGFKPKALLGVANGAFSNAKFIEGDQKMTQYIMDANYSVNPKSDLTKQVMEKYKAKYNMDLGPNAAYAYTSTKVLIDAIERAGSTDKEKIREALTKTNFPNHILPQGPVEFDEKGQNKHAQAVLTQIIDGKALVVYPEEYKKADPVFPTP